MTFSSSWGPVKFVCTSTLRKRLFLSSSACALSCFHEVRLVADSN
eukprot:CAMPEP_0183421072 /NCGR_PEP_ID=MMETSP0370-20130417/26858_1 /TAXON_ID=268820 /ORGANISM="Peridinium aciculiferum, Strain PAER-2" /LENGTH=44 /DNA_ID= /DNA_START= /DNA_END= /DNA_ORIENTATION=